MSSSGTWTVRLARDAAKQLEKLPTDRQEQVRNALREMAREPLSGDIVRLKGKQWSGRLRKRVGRYRVIFTLNRATRTVDVSAIVARSENTYR
jgi:mRNA-degrading endonuclease RelE of RelBE toxin-antitoxin system